MSRRRSGPPRCRDCGAPVVFFRSPFTGKPRTFEPRAVAAGEATRPAYPVVNNATAWRTRDLVEDLMVRFGISETEATEHVHAMPWHYPHECATRTPTPPEETR